MIKIIWEVLDLNINISEDLFKTNVCLNSTTLKDYTSLFLLKTLYFCTIHYNIFLWRVSHLINAKKNMITWHT